MAKVRNGALPSPSPERCVSYERLSGGLNLWELDYRLRRSESPEMKNLIWRDGTLNCRDGQVWLNETVRGAGHAMADRPFHGFLVFHAGTKLYACDRQTGTVSLLRSGLTQQPGSFFIYNESLYYKNRGGYLAIAPNGNGGLSASPGPAYTPVTLINADPDSGGYLFRCDYDGGNGSRLLGRPCRDISLCQEKLYCLTTEDQGSGSACLLAGMDFMGRDLEILTSQPVSRFVAGEDGIFYVSSETGFLEWMTPDGKTRYTVTTSAVSDFNLAERWIFYRTGGDNALYRMRTDGSDSVRLS